MKRLISALTALTFSFSALPAKEVFAVTRDLWDETIKEISTSLDNDDSSFKTVSSTGVTRAEWIHELVTVFDVSVEDDSTMEYYYTDISGSSYEYDINLAANYGIFDIESDEFEPGSYVTREFAAHTANSCMNYLDDGTSVSFSDSDDIYYEYDAIVAVQRGWFTLSSGNFLPDNLMTEAEEQRILDDAESSVLDTTVDPYAENSVNYQESVVQIDDTIDASYFDGKVTLGSSDVSLSKGNIFSVTIDGISRVYKASSVSKTDDGKTIVSVTDADLKDAVSDIDIQGYGDVDYDNIMFYGTSSASSNINLVDSGQESSEPNSIKSQLVKSVSAGDGMVTISETIDLGGVSIDLSGSVSNIKPEYKLDFNGIVVNDFYLNAHADADFTCSMTGELVNKTASKEIKLAKIPVACGGVMSANIVISISVSVTGKITLKYSWDVSGGVSYVKGRGWRVTKNFQKKAFSIEATGSEKIAIKGALDVELLDSPAGEVYIMGGEKGTFTHTPHSNEGVTCDNLRVYAFAEFGASINLFDLIKFPPQSYEFINDNNSPLRFNRHWENGKVVDECSFDANATNTDASRTGGKAGYYTDYSPYGSEFDGFILAPDESSAYQTWDESMTLEQSITINGDLYLENDVNLNGYTLTVTGDLFQNYGKTNVNGGTLNVGGNYEISSDGYLDMDFNNNSLVNVNKDFIIKNTVDSEDYYSYSDDFFSSGTLSIGGNFYQYIEETTSKNFISSYDHIVKFVGAGTHEVYFDSVDSYFTNVMLDDGAKLKFTGIFKGFPLKQDIVIEGDTQLDAGTLALNGYNLTIEGDFTQDSSVDVYNGTLDIQGDYTANSDLYNGGEKTATVTINGQLFVQSGSFDVENTTVNVSSDLLQTGGGVHVNGGSLNVDGNYEISSDGYLDMDFNNNSLVNVNKDFIIKNTVDSEDYYSYSDDFFSSGTLSIGGNFYQYIEETTSKNFISSYDHIVKFVGAGTHEVYFDSVDSYFTNVMLDDGAKLKFTGIFKGFPLKQDIVIEGDTQLDAGTLALNGHKLTIEGDFTQDSSIDVYNGVLDIQGDYTTNSDFYNGGEKTATVTIDGQLSIQSGNFAIGKTTANVSSDLIQTGGELHVNGGTLNVDGNYEISSDGCLNMDFNSNSLVNVSKDFTIKNTIESYYSKPFADGTLSIGGNFYQYIAETTANNFITRDNFVVKFVGAGNHTFYSESAETSLDNLTVEEGATVLFQGALSGMDMDNSTLTSSKNTVLSSNGNSITALVAGVSFLTVENGDVNKTITVTVIGAPEYEDATGDANGNGSVTVADVVLLQNWLLSVPGTRLTAWNSVDMNKDGKLDAFDLTLLKHKLIYE